MALDFDLSQFTEKAQATVQAAVQLVKDRHHSAHRCLPNFDARSVPRTPWFRTLGWRFLAITGSDTPLRVGDSKNWR
jgi:hypothetical protein